jgi:hypothetical protein
MIGAALLASMPVDASEDTKYTFDALGRLVLVSSTGGPRGGHTTTTGYDPAGNRSQVSVNVPTPPQVTAVTFSIAGPGTVTKGSPAVFTITKTGPAYNAVSVNFATADGSAVSPGDYTGSSGTLTFQTSETQKTVSIAVPDNGAASLAKQFSMTIGSPSAGSSINTASATAAIAASVGSSPVTQPDNATVPTCSARVVNVVANDTDPSGGTLTVTSVTAGTLGQASVSGTTSIRYAAYGSAGGDSVTYTVQNSSGHTATGTLNVTVVDQGGCQ